MQDDCLVILDRRVTFAKESASEIPAPWWTWNCAAVLRSSQPTAWISTLTPRTVNCTVLYCTVLYTSEQNC